MRTLLAILMLLTAVARAQEAPDAPMAPAFEAFAAADYALAESRLRVLLPDYPESFILHYNLACAISMQGRGQEAADLLLKAVRLGFNDLATLKIDPHLESARSTGVVAALEARWGELTAAQADRAAAALRARFGDAYRYDRDPGQRLLFASGFDARATDAALVEIGRVHTWFAAAVEPSVRTASPVDAWVSIILPTREDFDGWARKRFGPAAAGEFFAIGGQYAHDRKELVASDLGPTLRHEYAHVLHWRHMTRLGQRHPVWIMEGLCALAEDLDTQPGRHDAPVASWRSNAVKRLASAGTLTPIERFVEISHQDFAAKRPLRNYAIARTLFLFLHDRGELRAFYETYTADPELGYDADRSGLRALHAVTGLRGRELDRAFRLYVRSLEMVPERVAQGSASLGIEVGPGAGLGPEVLGVTRTFRTRAERRAFPLRRGDIITGIDERPTRDLSELIRVLGLLEPGREVIVDFRRGGDSLSQRLQLIARP